MRYAARLCTDHDELPYRIQYGPNLMQLASIRRGAIRLRTTERPNGAETAQRKSSPEDDENKKEDAFHFIMRLPFLYAHTLAKTESHWLKQRARSRWWKRGRFPKVGHFHLHWLLITVLSSPNSRIILQ